MTEKIEDMFIAHQSEVNYVKRLLSCKIDGQYIKGYHDAVCYIFSKQKTSLESWDELWTAEQYNEDMACYFDHENGLEEYKLLTYRGESIPVYIDDYGQQFIAKIGGKYVGAGACSSERYAFMYFSDLIDYELDRIC